MRALISLAVLMFISLPLSAATLLFDQGHGQRFVIEERGELDLSELANTARLAGFSEVRASRAALDWQTLNRVGALIISGGFDPYSDEEINAIDQFLLRGGRLAIMLHVGPLNGRLLNILGINVSNGIVREPLGQLGEKSSDFTVTNIVDHPLTRGVKRFQLYGAWALNNWGTNTQILASSSPQAWIDLDRNQRRTGNEPMQQWGVIATGQRGLGAFVIYGDDTLFQNKFLHGNNRRLAQNLMQWLLDAKTPFF